MKVNLIRRRGFSLVELFIAMIIIAVFTSFITSNITSQNQTAKQEAEKLAMYITDLTRKADRRHMSFTIKFEDNEIVGYWREDKKENYIKPYIYKSKLENGETQVLTPGFTLEPNVENLKLKYNPEDDDNLFSNVFGVKIKLTRTLDGSTYYVVVKKSGRIRTSEDGTDDED